MASFGVIGLGVMGQNLALNIEEHGFPVAVWNYESDWIDRFLAAHPGKQLTGAKRLEDLVAAIERPRRILVMIKAGAPVDQTLVKLRPLLSPGDVVIDGGNSWWEDTQRREAETRPSGAFFFGAGVSGGEEGARHGPCLMPGGAKDAYASVQPVFEAIAARTESGPCVTYIGPGGAGHFVKMVHNGIEYGDMQLIAEAYDILRTVGGLEYSELADTFGAWNRSELQSFLIEITSKIFTKKDDQGTGKMLVELIVDATGMKGTGKWTVQQASELAAPIPTIASSVEARIVSAQRAERLAASKILSGPKPGPANVDKKQLIDDVRHALYASKICSYAQGMNLLKTASKTYEWGLQLGRISRIWKGGCIIRAAFLDRIKQAYERDANLPNLLIDSEFAKELGDRQAGWRRVIGLAVQSGLAMPTMTASLAYYDSYRRERLPANLTQAQRDFFGAHTYLRLDKEGSYHTEWSE